MSFKLTSGQKVKLSKLDNSNVSHHEVITRVEAKVTEISEDKIELELLNLSVNFDDIEFIRIGMLLNLCFADNNALYKVGVEVREIKNVTKLVVIKRSKVQQIQRRRSFRVPIRHQIDYSIIDEELEGESDFESATVVDISTMGLKMIITSIDNIDSGMSLSLKLNLGILEDKLIRARVTRVEEEENSLGVEFIDVDDDVKQKLTRWIFEKEKELIEQGKKELKS